MKKRTLTLLLLFIVSLYTFVSCKKESKNIKVLGFITDVAGNKIEGVNVTLQGTLLQGGAYSTGFSDIATVKTDANGFYKIDTKWQTVDKYKITLFKYNYFENSYQYISDDFPIGEKVTKNLTIDPMAWIKIVVNNVDPDGNGDRISYKYDTDKFSLCADCCNNTPIVGNGMLYSNVLKCKLTGNKNAKISWTVQKGGSITSYTDNVFCTAFDTTTFNINY
jgi:hypothetical protein